MKVTYLVGCLSLSLLVNQAFAENRALTKPQGQGGALIPTQPSVPVVPTTPKGTITTPKTNTPTQVTPTESNRGRAVGGPSTPNKGAVSHSDPTQLKQMGELKRSTDPSSASFDQLKTELKQTFGEKNGNSMIKEIAEQRKQLQKDPAAKDGQVEYGKMLAKSKGDAWRLSKDTFLRLKQNGADPKKMVDTLASLPCHCLPETAISESKGRACRLMQTFKKATAHLPAAAVLAACTALFGSAAETEAAQKSENTLAGKYAKADKIELDVEGQKITLEGLNKPMTEAEIKGLKETEDR